MAKLSSINKNKRRAKMAKQYEAKRAKDRAEREKERQEETQQ